MHHWLFKSEPESFSIDHLKNKPNHTTHWDGVRNYQARNFMREMQVGDLGFFYHSNCTTPGIVGIVEIVKTAYPDFTAWDEDSKYFDPKGPKAKPRWFMVDVKFVKKFKKIISLEEIKNHPALDSMQICRKGNRLSITPVSKEEWKNIITLAG